VRVALPLRRVMRVRAEVASVIWLATVRLKMRV
jgi:hypothetical protein